EEKIIKDAEKELDIIFPEQIRLIIKNYGSLSFKHWELFGLGVKNNSHLNIVKNTLELRKAKLPKQFIPIINVGDGIYIVTDTKNNVYEFRLFSEKLKKLDDSLDNFLFKLFNEGNS
ncbi:MAG: SMI1/KNR4 family protein, partial [Ignavibacterium sp.]|nr:SMI1/KNR4 family protein [Ignavibacterium sp.]MDW8375670.1 SMI1/KNR4 family protein [Ignavibacteriales bacterium]